MKHTPSLIPVKTLSHLQDVALSTLWVGLLLFVLSLK